MMASQVLVFMAKGINNNLQQSLGYFATQTATSDMLFPLMWEAVAYLEQQGLKVGFFFIMCISTPVTYLINL